MPARTLAPATLLEREPQLAALAELWRDARSGRGRVALVSGEAGIGKTSLLNRFTADLDEPETVLWGACDALFTPRPLAPLHDIALRLGGPLRERLEADAPRLHVFAALLEALLERPRAVVIEDLHWADEATLDLLRWLGRRIARTNALLVASFRDDELAPGHPLRGVIGDLAAAGVASRIELPALSPEAVRRLAGDRDVDARALHASTGGNAFLVTEVLAAGGRGVPPNVRDAVLARAARLGASARAVLDAAAVVGPRIELDVLAGMVASETASIEECMAAGVLKPLGDALAFRHELARQAVLDAIAPPRRQTLHAMALAALRARPGAPDAARLAHHAEAARDRDAVLEFAPVAAREAAAAGAHRQACEQWARALRAADALPGAERASMLESFAQECWIVGRADEGIAARIEAIGLWQELGRPERVGENLCLIQSLYVSVGRNAEAEAASVRSLEVLEPLPRGPELALAYRYRSYLRMLARDNEEAVAWGERALALAEEVGPFRNRVAALNSLGTALCFVDFERGCAALEQSRALADGVAGLESSVTAAWLMLGSASGEVHEFRRADAYLAQGIAYAAEQEHVTQEQYMTAWRALTHLHLGRWEDAAACAGAIAGRADATAISRNMALLALGRLRARRGDPGVWDALDEALAIARTSGHLQRLGPVHAARAEAALLAGDAARAGAEARAAWDLATAKRHPWFVGELAWWRCQAGETPELPDDVARPYALQLAGDWSAAAAEWERMGCPYERARALAEGDVEAQREALASFDRLGARPAADRLRQRMRQQGVRSVPRGPRASTRDNAFGLTAREREILRQLAAGGTNAAIARRLHLSTRTVDHHVAAILAKLDAPSREAAVRIAAERGLIAED